MPEVNLIFQNEELRQYMYSVNKIKRQLKESELNYLKSCDFDNMNNEALIVACMSMLDELKRIEKIVNQHEKYRGL